MFIINKRTFLSLCLFLFCFIQFSCSDEKIADRGKDLPKRTVLIYMAADNNLSSFAETNIANAILGAGEDNLNGGNLLIYVDPIQGVPQLLQIVKNKKGIVEKQVVRTYLEHNSSTPEIMRDIINDVMSEDRYKADSYGLILWSHGTAWLPFDIYNYLRSFGEDHGSAFSMDDLKSAIPDDAFDFILFDACYMSSIEVAYALKEKTKYILGSPTEVLAEGLPYRYIIKDLFSNESTSELLKNIGHRFYTYYNQQEGGTRNPKSATVSLVNTEALPQMAAVCKDILRGKEQQIYNLPIREIQIMEYLFSYNHALYDFEDYIKQIASAEQYTRFQGVLADLIPYKETTEKSYYAIGLELPINRFSGLSVYIPQSNLGELNEWYKSQDWYKAVYE